LRPNLRFLEGDTRSIPLPDDAVDVVVSFETIEHFYEQERFLAEVKRVLRPGGRFIVSSPERDVYSPVGGPVNPFHVRELTREEFTALLNSYFSHATIFGQRPLLGSALIAESTCPQTRPLLTFERRDATHFEASPGLPRPIYLLAVVSDTPVDERFGSLYIETSNLDGLFCRLGDAENKTKELNSRLMEECEHVQRIQAELADRNVELSAKLKELERCHWQIIQRDDEQQTLAAAYQKLSSENASLRRERVATNARLAAVLDSTSWQLTAPLRKVVGRLRSIVTV
jgi:hypothetical protein